MSEKARDNNNRWRNVTVGFRMSPEETNQLDTLVKLTGLSKQDYIISRLLCRDVHGNPRVYKALRDQLSDVLVELKRIDGLDRIDEDLFDTIQVIASILDGSHKVDKETTVIWLAAFDCRLFYFSHCLPLL